MTDSIKKKWNDAPITAKTPWIDHLGEVPSSLNYFDGTMFEMVEPRQRRF